MYDKDSHLPAKRGKIDQKPVTRSTARKEEAENKYEEFCAKLQKPFRFSVEEKRDVEYRHLIGSDPTPSDQQEKKSCYAHAVAKGLVKIFDGNGFDCDQEAIIKELENKVGTDAQTYGAFHNIRLEVKIFRQGHPRSEWSKDTQIIILSEVKKKPSGGVTPRLTEDELKDRHMAMVLTSISQSHAMYVESYDPSKQEYQAINSWGQKDPRPVVPIADVDSLDYIQIKKVQDSKRTERQPLADHTNMN